MGLLEDVKKSASECIEALERIKELEQLLEGDKMGKTVKKKILPVYYDAVIRQDKKFELRKDEDNIKAGDELILSEWDGEKYTGRVTIRLVRYVLRNVPEYGLKEGYCIIGW